MYQFSQGLCKGSIFCSSVSQSKTYVDFPCRLERGLHSVRCFWLALWFQIGWLFWHTTRQLILEPLPTLALLAVYLLVSVLSWSASQSLGNVPSLSFFMSYPTYLPSPTFLHPHPFPKKKVTFGFPLRNNYYMQIFEFYWRGFWWWRICTFLHRPTTHIVLQRPELRRALHLA